MPTAAKKFKGLKGEYLLLASLGQGSSSEVRLAKQLEVEGAERFLVYKQLKAKLAGNEGQTKRFIREARIASIFDHDSLPRTVETGKVRDTYFVMQEFLLGDSLGYLLSQAVEAGQVVTPRLAACMAVQVCDALAYIHGLQSAKGEGLNLLHRNVNLKTLVLLPSGRVKLTNMNLRRREDLPHPTSCLGHQSPELAAGLPTGAATDIFSVGVVLWETLTGRHLFMQDSKLDTKMAVSECQVTPPREIRSNVPEELEQVVLKALQKEAGDRFASAGEMAQALRTFLGDMNEITILEEVRQFTERAAHDRFRGKAGLLEDIEAGRAQEIDAGLLLPKLDFTLLLAGQEPPEEETAPETTAEPEAEAEAKPEMESEEPSGEEKEEVEAKTSPQIGEPAAKARMLVDTWLQMLRDRDWRAIAGTTLAVVLVMLIIGLAFSSGEEEPDEAEAADDQQVAVDQESEKAPEAALEEPVVEETAPPKDAERPALARLEVVSDPVGCAVKLDDMELSGRTPLKNVILPAAVEYQVEVACADYEVESRKVTPEAGKSTPLEFYPPEKGDQGKRYGRLQLVTKPKTTVYLGKRKLGTTPLKGVKLPAGTHKLRLVNPKRKINKRLEVAIEPGETTKLRPKL